MFLRENIVSDAVMFLRESIVCDDLAPQP